MEFDINRLQATTHQKDRYIRRLKSLQKAGRDTSCIESAVSGAIDNIRQKQTRAFVIYGEPQSGKTEMMIALTAHLLDEGYKIIVHLLNDSLQLLEQNLERFQRSGLAPTPCNFSDILDPSIKIRDGEHVIFCKKNARDLEKLIDKIGSHNNKIIIDDEADYATPNSKVNKGQKTKINNLIEKLLAKEGIYVGVTATPARLDLNYTFENDHEKWVNFPIHSKYTGQDIFFPLSPNTKFIHNSISDLGDAPKWCREALFRFLINVAYLNLHPEINGAPKNYSFLVHTSGIKTDHQSDYEEIHKVFGVLSDNTDKKHESYLKQIWDFAEKRYPDKGYKILDYIRQNIGSKNIVVMNSDKKDANYKSATDPSALFTIVIGGNIVSRGVTFDNLLSMYFTRDVKHKLQQDTYIQRARMFGSRGDYLPYFELTIPDTLYQDWHRCFIFHRLSLSAIKSGKGAPVWLEDSRIATTAAPSIDRLNVSLDGGEMSYMIFDYGAFENKVTQIMQSQNESNISKLKKLHALLGENALPEFVLSYIQAFTPNGDNSIMIHEPYSIAGSGDADQKNISRKKGFMGGAAFTKNPQISHHFRILYNKENQARLFYKYTGSVSFLKNTKGSLGQAA